MEAINMVIIIGSEETGGKILRLLSKANLKLNLKERDYLQELTEADLILESSLEDFESRKDILRRCGEKASPNAILATTSPKGITELAAATRRPQNFLGLNFVFNPFQEEKCLVQIVRGLETSEEIIGSCQNLAEKVGAETVVVEDSPGLILDRVMASVINEAANMYAAKIATVEDIDRITKLCLNWPMGPFEFADAIGIDKVLATLETLSQEIGPQFMPCRLIKQMVAIGKLGRKTGKGFYTYS